MTPDHLASFSAKLVELADLFDVELSESKMALYYEALADLPLPTVLEGLRAAARSCKFFPRPAEIRATVTGSDDDTAERAWLTFKEVARTVGGYGSPVFEDPALAEALLAVFGSWEAACWTDLSPEMWASKRKEFGRVYRVVRQRGLSGAKALPGFVERENHLRGYTQSALSALPDTPDRKTLAAGPD